MADDEKVFVCRIENRNVKELNDVPGEYRDFIKFLTLKGLTINYDYDEITNSTTVYCKGITEERFLFSKLNFKFLKALGLDFNSVKIGGNYTIDKKKLEKNFKSRPAYIDKTKIGYRIRPVPSFVNDISQLDYEDYVVLSYLRDSKGFQFGFINENGTNYLYCINKSGIEYDNERVDYFFNVRPTFEKTNKAYSVENAAHFIVSEGKRCTSEQLEKMKRISKEGKEQFATLGYDETFEMLDEIDDTLDTLQSEELRELRNEVAIQSYSIKESEDKFAFLEFISARIEHFILEKNKRLEGIMKLILGVIKEEVNYTVGNQSDTFIEVNSDILFAIDSLNNADREGLKIKLGKYLETCDVTEYLPINNILIKMQEQEKEKEKKDLAQSYRSL